MERYITDFKRFLINNKIEIFSVLSLFLILFFLTLFLHPLFGNLIIDSGREAYFPQQVLEGKVLYKDIFNLFGPLSYELNALFYKILGINIKSLFVAGFFISCLILFSLYFIARLFTSRGISWIICFFIIASCFMHPGLFNYIFPYAFAITYSLCGFLFSILFLLLYIKKGQTIFIPLSWFFAGISFASKYEYFLYFGFLSILTLYFVIKKNFSKKVAIISFAPFWAVPLLCFAFLFHQGLTLKDFFIQLPFINRFASAPSLIYFYKNSVGLYPQKAFLGPCIETFKEFSFCFLGIVTSIYLALSKTLSFPNRLLACLCLYLFGWFLFIQEIDNDLFFCWLPYFSLILTVFIILNYSKKQDSMILCLFIVSLLASAKSFFCLNMNSYGVYFFPLLFIANIIFLTEYIPSKFDFIDKKKLKQSIFIILFILSLIALKTSIEELKNKYPIFSKRGTVYSSKNIARSMQKTINYIEQNLDPNATIWVIPEGITLNFLVNRPIGNIYYASNSPYIETFGENKIINDIKKTPPDYIIINNRLSPEYGFDYICKDYGQKICQYINKNYTRTEFFGVCFKFNLYKKNYNSN